jgi:hypothetical protein
MVEATPPEDNGAIVRYVRTQRGHASMLIAGEWQMGDDGVSRPIVQAHVFGEPTRIR